MGPTKLVFAADLGGTHLRAAAIDELGQIYHRSKTPTPRSSNPDQIVRVLVDAVQECAQHEHEPISALSVAVPGTVDVSKGLVRTVPNLRSLDGFGLAAALETATRLPTRIENDANAAAVGESWQGAARSVNTSVCVTLGTGVGGGIVLDGKLWRGADDSAGEIGHMSIDPFGEVVCGCGGRGCLEVYASATAIVRMTHEALDDYPSSSLQGEETITSEVVYRAGMEGDDLAREVFRRMGVYLGVGLANLVNVINPEMIVIGGGVANGWELFADHAKEEMAKRAFPVPGSRVKLRRAECGDDAGLLGAARLALTA